MYSIYLEVYTGFLILIFIFLTANAILPKKKGIYNTKRNYRPKTLVMLPCKGNDIGLVNNLNAIKKQSYKNYDVIAIVDSKKDPAFKAIEATNTKFMISDFKCKNCSGKVRALSSALSKFKSYDAYVILDSDVLVSKDWLELLIAPLSDRRIGISTAYPVFKPVGGFWSKVKHAWGFVGQALMESDRTRFGWGGSLAFRKDLISKTDFEYFSKSISDDIALTNIAKAKGLKLAYVKEADPIILSNENFSRFAEWSNRQSAIFVKANRSVLYQGLVYYSASILLLISAVLLAVFVNALFVVLLLPSILGAIKLYRRSKGHVLMLVLYFMMNFLYLANLLKARGMSTIKWRGNAYDITSIAK
jgi:cellulose synthase/poly-beta-1,6-N-acetylglucosamine synthase-like glycosyltransferase